MYFSVVWTDREATTAAIERSSEGVKKEHNSKHVLISGGVKQKGGNFQLHHHINRVRVEVMCSLLFALRGGKKQLYIYLIYIWLFVTNSNKMVVYGICVGPLKKKANQREFPEKRQYPRYGRRRYHF